MISDAPSANGVISLSHTSLFYALTFSLIRGCRARGPNVSKIPQCSLTTIHCAWLRGRDGKIVAGEHGGPTAYSSIGHCP